MSLEKTQSAFEVIEAAFPTRFRAIIDTPGVIDDAYRSDFVRAVEIIERQRNEIRRLQEAHDLLRDSVSHLRCKHDGDNDFEPEHKPGECAECDIWR